MPTEFKNIGTDTSKQSSNSPERFNKLLDLKSSINFIKFRKENLGIGMEKSKNIAIKKIQELKENFDILTPEQKIQETIKILSVLSLAGSLAFLIPAVLGATIGTNAIAGLSFGTFNSLGNLIPGLMSHDILIREAAKVVVAQIAGATAGAGGAGLIGGYIRNKVNSNSASPSINTIPTKINSWKNLKDGFVNKFEKIKEKIPKIEISNLRKDLVIKGQEAIKNSQELSKKSLDKLRSLDLTEKARLLYANSKPLMKNSFAKIENSLKSVASLSKNVFIEVKDFLGYNDNLESSFKLNENIANDETLFPLSNSESNKLFKDIEIRGDWKDENGRGLTPELIQKYDLLPKYPVKIGGREVFLSDSIIIDSGGRSMVYYYIKNEQSGKLAVRTAYKSNSQGMYRLLPRTTINGHYDKGRGEDSINLPNLVQYAISTYSVESKQVNDEDERLLLFRGTTKRYDPKGNNTYFDQTESKPEPIVGIKSDHEVRVERFKQKKETFAVNLQNPETFVTTHDNEKPNFGSISGIFESENSIIGKYKCYVVPSNDNSFEYLFCVDTLNRVWIGNLEVKKAKINDVGVRERWAANICVPLYDYCSKKHNQCGGFEDLDDIPASSSHYAGLWKNYLSKIPMIIEFRQKVLGISN
jgi:hypothetical protein